MNEIPQKLTLEKKETTSSESVLESKNSHYDVITEQAINIKKNIEDNIFNLGTEGLNKEIYDNTEKYIAIIKNIEKLSSEMLNYSRSHQKNIMTDIMCHDIKASATASIGLIEIFQEEKNNGELTSLNEYTSIIIKSFNNVIKLIEELIEHINLQLNNFETNFSKFNIKNELGSIVNENIHTARSKNIEIINSTDDVNIISDKTIIQTAVRNLITNSLKFTPEGGKIIIASNIDDNYINISVSDTGVGIREDDIKSILNFDKYFKTRGINGELGSGVAIKIIKEMLEKIGGQIEIESEIGKGSTFSVKLPIEK